LTINEQLTEFLKVLDSFSDKTGINKFQSNEQVDSILDSSELVRNTWDEESLNNKAFTLYSYGAYLQRCINQQNIKLKWAQSNLRVLYGKESKNYDRWSYEERKDSIIGDNNAALALHEIIMNAETRIAQLSHLSNYISEMARSLTEMAKSKRASRYENRG